MNPNSRQKRIAFGYERLWNGSIVLHEAQAKAVQLIYNLYAEGRPISEIKMVFENCHIPSPQNKPSWSKQTISNILLNPHYVGSDAYPQIVSQELFDKVQAIKEKNRC